MSPQACLGGDANVFRKKGNRASEELESAQGGARRGEIEGHTETSLVPISSKGQERFPDKDSSTVPHGFAWGQDVAELVGTGGGWGGLRGGHTP